MTSAAQRLSDLDLVLIDTSGRSHRDAERLVELRSLLEAARRIEKTSAGDQEALRGLETHLVLSCTSAPQQLVEVGEKFAAVGVDRILFTKLDEAVGLGVILNVARRLNLQMSYLTTGQNVPDDIEVGHRRRIAEMVLDGTPGISPSAPGRGAYPASIDHVS